MNEFVKNRADKFQMTPKSGNWKEIEKRIEKKSKKKLLWFLLPGLFFIGSLTGYQFSQWKIDSKLLLQKDHIGSSMVEEGKKVPVYAELEMIKDRVDLVVKTEPVKKENSQNRKKPSKLKRGSMEMDEFNMFNKFLGQNTFAIATEVQKDELQVEKENIEFFDEVALVDLEMEQELIAVKDTADPASGVTNNGRREMALHENKYAIHASFGYGMTKYFHKEKAIALVSPTSHFVGRYFEKRELDDRSFATNMAIGISKRIGEKYLAGVDMGLNKFSWTSVVGDTIPAINFGPTGNNGLKANEKVFGLKQSLREQTTSLYSYHIGLFGQRELFKYGKTSLNARVGINYQRIYKATALTYDLDKKFYVLMDQEGKSIQENLIGLRIDLPVEYKIAKNLNFSISPAFTTTLNSAYDSKLESRRPYFIGVVCGLSLGL